MSMHAGFLKRLFAAIIDITLVIVVTYLLYLFPFNMIIGNGINKNYKESIKKPYEAINAEYVGETSFFGASSDGKLKEMQNLYQSKAIFESNIQAYRYANEQNYTRVNYALDCILEDVEVPYNPETEVEDQFYSALYLIYNYVSYEFTTRNSFKVNSEYRLYSYLEEKGEISTDQKNEFEKAYTDKLVLEHTNVLRNIIAIYKYYGTLNEDLDVNNLVAFRNIVQNYNQSCNELAKTSEEMKNNMDSYKLDNIEPVVSSSTIEVIKNYIDYYKDYTDAVTTTAWLGEKGPVDEKMSYNFTDEAYHIFYYAISSEQFYKQLPYYEAVYLHSNYTIIYALSMFTLVLSLYTTIMRGQTLGRRGMSIKLVSLHEKDKLNPVLALLHDVPFRVLYVLLLGMFSLPIALIVFLIFTIADGVMIRFTGNHKCIRDIISMTKVIEKSSR